MANERIFTNTYVTGSGRNNFLRIDSLEDPLFTSFTFDIDYTSSPLFYTIGDYDYPNTEGLANRIETSLSSMYSQNMGEDQGYDILPMLSANFIEDKKLGFGLQQNVYTDLPLYGATEYIYMVDKRNGDGSQNDVRYDSNGGYSNSTNSYKLGNSIKEAVSESDRMWAENQRAQAQAQVDQCREIMGERLVVAEHNQNVIDMETALTECNGITETVTVDGLPKAMNEGDLLIEVDKYKAFDDAFEKLKRDIINWANGEIISYQNKIKGIYNSNKCVVKIMSYDDVTKSENKDELERLYTEDFREIYIWDDDGSFLKKCLELYNEYETYSRDFSGPYVGDDGKSFFVEEVSSNSAVNIRDSKIIERFEDSLKIFGFNVSSTSFTGNNGRVELEARIMKDLPDWAYKLSDYLGHFVSGQGNLITTTVLYPLRYECEISMSFINFSTDVVEDNRKKLIEYETALDNIRSRLYGYENGQACDISNPSPYSPYGRYVEAKERCENDTYTQAQRTISMSQSGIDELDSILSDSGDGGDSDDSGNNDNTNDPVSAEPQPSDATPISSTTNIAPQTVLDMLGFISGMKKMTMEYPYIMNGITGLDKAYNSNYGIKDPYLGSGDNKITITCWESLDLRVSSMFNRYFNAVYDRQYRRERVPLNLRRFNCSIYVHDIRNFVSKIRGEYANRLLELTDMYYSVIEFRFYDCEIVPEETGNIFDNISNEAPSDMKKTNFTFTYGNCVVNFVPHSEVATY